MKKLFTFLVGIFFVTTVSSQEISDALRYSLDHVNGTARFSSMSGAFTALGGDLSAISVNPASSAVFSSSYASVTLGNMDRNNETSYFNGMTSTSESRFDLQQGGGVLVFNNVSGSPWKKISVGFNYDQTGNYNDYWYASGNNSRSIDRFFLQNANGLRLDEISAFENESLSEAYFEIGDAYGYRNQQAFLGYESYIIDPVLDTDDNTSYISSISPGIFEQDYFFSSQGYSGKFAVNFATQYQDVLYLGLNLNGHIINYENSTFLNEYNDNVGSFINEIEFENRLFTTGQGFSFQLGGIVKVTEQLRAGLSYTSPTWYTIQDETLQYLRTYSYDNDSAPWITINPQVSNLYPEYKLKTPANFTAGLAYVFGDSGLLSFDYGRKDYSKMEFRPDNDPYFQDQNAIISDRYKAASTYKFGGEYRIKGWSFRGGYRFEEGISTDNSFGDLNGYSLGLGYSFGNFKLDAAFLQSKRSVANQLYSIGLTDSALVDIKNTLLNFTIGFSI